MKILDFTSFKLLLEAEGDAPAPDAAPAPEPAPIPPAPEPAPMPSAPIDNFTNAELPVDPNAIPVNAPPTSLRVILIEPDKKWHSQYSDGGGVKRFSDYEIEFTNLDKWITDSGLDAQKDQLYKALQGKEPLDKSTFAKLKGDLVSGKIGLNIGDLDIEFDPKGIPSTNDLSVNFVNVK